MTPPPHPGFSRVFAPERLTLGFMFPIARVEHVFPSMTDQLDLARRVDTLGFAAVWVRDVPLFDPDFGDVGQIYDPWVWLGQVAAVTREIALATGAIVLPLRHPIHIAKAAASVDVLSGGRFLLGLASGDRPVEFPAFGAPFEARGDSFAEGFELIRLLLAESFPHSASRFGVLDGKADLVPKPARAALPLLVAGSARQTVQWLAAHADAWVAYPRDAEQQKDRVAFWRNAVAQRSNAAFKPFAQSLFIDLTESPNDPPTPIFLGYRLGRVALISHLQRLRDLGVNHVFFNLRHSTRPAAEVVEELADAVLPAFPAIDPEQPRPALRALA